MAKYCTMILMMVAQACFCSGAVLRQTKLHVESSMHTQSNASMMFMFSQGLWNNTITNMIQTEIEMTQAKASEPFNKVVYVLATIMFPLGCDRCVMGQFCLGTVKAMTFGGFFVWAIVDYWLCLINAISKEKDINAVWYKFVWKEDTIEPAYTIWLVVLGFQLLSFLIKSYQAYQAQRMISQIMAQAAQQPNATVRERSFAVAPTMLMRNLRQAGFVKEKPTMAELIAQFKAMDKNGDGQLDHDELKGALAAMGTSDGDVDEMIKNVDKDGDGKVSIDEFLLNMMGGKQNES